MQGGGIAGVLVMERNLQVLGCRDPTAGLLLDPESQKILLHVGGGLRGLNTSGTRLVAVMDIGLVGAARAAGSTSGGWMEGRGCKQGAGLLPRSRLLLGKCQGHVGLPRWEICSSTPCRASHLRDAGVMDGC